MDKLSIDTDIILGTELMDIHALIPHEEIITSRKEQKKEKFKKKDPISFSTILVCNKSNVIIDGHHRYTALKELGFQKIPVTRIHYFSNKIITDENDSIPKSEIIKNAKNNNLFTPKSTCHLIYCNNQKKWFPMKTISTIYKIDQKRNVL